MRLPLFDEFNLTPSTVSVCAACVSNCKKRCQSLRPQRMRPHRRKAALDRGLIVVRRFHVFRAEASQRALAAGCGLASAFVVGGNRVLLPCHKPHARLWH